MKIELKESKLRGKDGGFPSHLYIDGKTDGIEYEDDGIQGKIYPWSIKRKHMEKLMKIKCRDYPDELRIWNITNYKIPPGEMGVFEINKKGKKMEFVVWFTFEEKGKYKDNNWPFNTNLFRNKIYSFSTGTVLKKKDNQSELIEETLDAKFTFHSDLKGTIGDKFKIAFKTLHEIVGKAEKEIISEAKQYLKTRKIKF
jgi:hypothetical protein